MIKKLRASKFRNFKDTVEFEFKPGITLIKAKNEGGKTSLRRAFATAFYGDPKSTGQGYKDLMSWGEDGMYEISVEFSSGGSEYRLTRDFEARSSTLIDLKKNKKISDKKKISEIVAEHLGLPTENLFAKTVCFSAEELSRVENAEDLRSRLEEKLSGVEGVSVAGLIAQIDKELAYLNKGFKRHAKEPGPIKHYKDKLDRLKQSYREIEQEVASNEKYLIKFNDVCAEIKTAEEKLRVKRKAYEKCEEYKNAKKAHDEAKEKFNYYHKTLEKRNALTKESEELLKEINMIKERGAALRDAIDKMQQVLDAAAAVETMQKQIETLKATAGRITEASKALEDVEKNLAGCIEVKKADLEKSEQLNTKIQSLKLAGEGQGFKIDIKLLGNIAPEIITDEIPRAWEPGRPVEAGAEALIIFPGVAELRVENKNTQAAENIKNERQAARELNEILGKYGVKNYGELAALNSARETACQEVKQKQTALNTLLDGKKPEDYSNELKALEKTMSESEEKIRASLPGVLAAMKKLEPEVDFNGDIASLIKEKKPAYEKEREDLAAEYSEKLGAYREKTGVLNDLPPGDELAAGKEEWGARVFYTEAALKKIKLPGMDIEKIAQLEEEISSLQERLESLRAEQTRLEIMISSSKYGAEHLEDLEEEIENTGKLLNKYLKREKVLQKVKELFEEARNKTLAKISESISNDLRSYFEELTGGRYRRVEINPAGLEIQVHSDDKGGCLDIDKEMSTGTRDQIYLAARLAMVPAAANGKKPPLFLDDSLVHFDRDRREKAFNILKQLSKEHQIFIFSCHDYYDDLADHVVNLPG